MIAHTETGDGIVYVICRNAGSDSFMQQLDDLDQVARPYAEALVDTLKSEGKLSSPLVEAAFRQVPRHPFIDHFYRLEKTDRKMQWQKVQPSTVQNSDTWLNALYANQPIIIAFDEYNMPTSSSSSPDAMAFMLEQLQLAPGMRVLEIGTGTGYNAALLAYIVEDPHKVFTVEIDEDLAHRAQCILDQVAGEGITVHAGDGLRAYAIGTPYDRIIATGSYHKVPLDWLDQLQQGGILMMNLRGHLGACAFLKVVKNGPGRVASGTFLAGSDFMELRDAQTPSYKVTDLVARYLGRPTVAQRPFTSSEFDPSDLWNHRLGFLLQLSFPEMYFTSVYVDPMCPCLIDIASDTVLVFRPRERQGEWIVEIKGQEQLWNKVTQAYSWWVETGGADLNEYRLEIDTTGKQCVILVRKDGGTEHIWRVL
jgi:protein-L-isoaspartate(D-aspartate) O-methyltransferase